MNMSTKKENETACDSRLSNSTEATTKEVLSVLHDDWKEPAPARPKTRLLQDVEAEENKYIYSTLYKPLDDDADEQVKHELATSNFLQDMARSQEVFVKAISMPISEKGKGCALLINRLQSHRSQRVLNVFIGVSFLMLTLPIVVLWLGMDRLAPWLGVDPVFCGGFASLGCVVLLMAGYTVYAFMESASPPPLKTGTTLPPSSHLETAETEDQRKEEDAGICSSLKEIALKPSLAPCQMSNVNRVASAYGGEFCPNELSNCINCEALYGVLRLGNYISVLIYVTQKTHVMTLHVGPHRHEVFRVVKLEWMQLPSLSSRRQKSNGSYAENLNVTKDPSIDRKDVFGLSSLDEETEACSQGSAYSQEDDDEEPKDRFDEATIAAYLKVVDRFCVSISKDMGKQSYLYYSPTVNLAMSPEEIMETQRTSIHGSQETSLTTRNNLPTRSSARASFESSTCKKSCLTTCKVFQWNYPLLEPFDLPTLKYLLKMSMKQLAHQEESNTEDANGNGEFASAVKCVREEQSYVCELMQLKSLHATLGNVSLLFIPSFIRGYASDRQLPSDASLRLQLVTRLSCCWAGTRYNRRGLEPGESGVCANLAISSLWLSQLRMDSDLPAVTSGAASFSRTSVLSTVRGSVPRRWEQPANLSFKPPLKISPASNAAEELDAHMNLLNKLLPGAKRLCLIDTMSTTQHEKPLSDAYNVAFERWKEGQVSTRGTPGEPHNNSISCYSGGRSSCTKSGESFTAVFYIKYNMKIKLKTLPLLEMKKDLLRAVRRALGMQDAADEEAEYSDNPPPEWVSFTTYASPRVDDDARATWEVRQQSLYYRINCLDCLDRTNVAQALLSDDMLPYLLADVFQREPHDGEEAQEEGLPLSVNPKFQLCLLEASMALRDLFAHQGIAISMMYTGVGAHFITFLRGGNKARYRPSIHEGMIALRRWYLQNFRDGLKQDMVSLVTRQHDPAQFSSNIEGPFSRDLTGMNLLVLYGIFASVVPLVFCVIFAFLSSDRGELRLHGTIACLWIAFFLFIYQKLSKYCVTYTNQALLNYSI